MFNSIKKIFERKEVSSLGYKQINTVNFKDLQLQDISICIEPSGNDTVLTIVEHKSNTKIVLSSEQCLLVSTILHEYARSGNLNRLSDILENKKEQN